MQVITDFEIVGRESTLGERARAAALSAGSQTRASSLVSRWSTSQPLTSSGRLSPDQRDEHGDGAERDREDQRARPATARLVTGESSGATATNRHVRAAGASSYRRATGTSVASATIR